MMYKAKKNKLLHQFVETVNEETKGIFGAIFKKSTEKKKRGKSLEKDVKENDFQQEKVLNMITKRLRTEKSQLPKKKSDRLLKKELHL